MPNQELEAIAQGYEALAPEVREAWAIEQIQTIRNTVAKELTVAEFQMGMTLAARYGLDPLANEIWFTKGRSQDGSPGRAMIMCGRDGFLKVARSNPDYRGIDCDVVRANDEFVVERLASGERLVQHKYAGSDVERGEIRGAWAIASFDGKTPFYYYAPITEYRPRSDKALKYSPWGSQESVMILKCAQSYVLRIASGISGMVGAEEYDRAREAQEPTAPQGDMDALAATLAELPPDLRDRLTLAFNQADELRPGHVTPAAVDLSVRGQSRERIEAYIVEVEEANRAAEPEGNTVEGSVEGAVEQEREDEEATDGQGFKPADAIELMEAEE